MRVVILGLSITSSWGNGHASTYRALVRSLSARGHDVLILERDLPWYAQKIIIPNTAHLPNMEKPEQFNQIVLEFLQGRRP